MCFSVVGTLQVEDLKAQDSRGWDSQDFLILKSPVSRKTTMALSRQVALALCDVLSAWQKVKLFN